MATTPGGAESTRNVTGPFAPLYRTSLRNAFTCLLYTSDAADARSSVDLGGRRILKKKKQEHNWITQHGEHTILVAHIPPKRPDNIKEKQK